MNKLTLTLSVLAAAALAGCGTHQVRADRAAAVEPAYAVPVDSTTPLRAGSGRVGYLVDPTGPVDGISVQRITLRMDDGSTQVIDRRGKQVALGEHVRLRADASVRRDPYTSKAAD